MSGAVQDVITHAKIGEDRLGVLVWKGIEFWPLKHSRTTVRVSDYVLFYNSEPHRQHKSQTERERG